MIISNDIDQQIKNYFLNIKKINSNALKKFFKNNKNIQIQCEKLLKIYPEWVNIGNIIFAIKNNTNLRHCLTCKKLIKFNRIQRIYCNNICRNHDPILIKKANQHAKNTCLKKYGVDNAHKVQSIINKTKQTCLKKYGVDNPAKTKQVQEKIKKTCLKKYGVKNIFQSAEIKNKIKKSYTGKQSQAEVEIQNFCKQYFLQLLIHNDELIPPFNVDIIIPQIKLVIQFNGIYWHRIENTGQNYHLNKTKLCNQKDFRLIHIWQDEWNKQKIEIKKKLINIFLNIENLNFTQQIIKLNRDQFNNIKIKNYNLIRIVETKINKKTKVFC